METPERRDPFATITHAKKYLWNCFDWMAYRRVRRLGVPTPWQAYQMGLEDGRTAQWREQRAFGKEIMDNSQTKRAERAAQ